MNLPQGIDSKYRFILVAAKRARQLQAGAKPLIQTSSKRPTRIAVMELEAGVVPFEGSRTKPLPEADKGKE
ncbi:MAG TPA: DNA-directed RNA polymerase subunit omega [Terriglobia bacterium]|nr:DNA-directed RNA polymerase subunit omega [Terriglobia bacterium]